MQTQQGPAAINIRRIVTDVLFLAAQMVLLGIGLLSLRHAGPDMDTPMLVFGTVVLMPGIGFIISAGVSWLLAAKLGLMPADNTAPGRFDSPLGGSPVFKDRQ